jgi:hypothetical protein
MKNNNTPLIIVLLIVLVLLLFGSFGYGMMGLWGGMMTGYYGFGWIFMIVAILCAIWVIYDVLVNNRRLSEGMKILWIILAIFFSIITAIIYYFFGRSRNSDLFRRR